MREPGKHIVARAGKAAESGDGRSATPARTGVVILTNGADDAARDLEPSPTSLAGRSPARAAKRLFLATRPKFFAASVIPVLLGSAWGYRVAGTFDVTAFVLALAAVLCVHAGVNVLNDVFDERGSDSVNTDRIHPYTGGSRFIQNGVLSAAQMARWGTILIGAAAVLGAALAVLEGMSVLLFGLAGIALGTLYSAPPVALAARGLGELAVAVGFGVLPVSGAAWLQSGTFDEAVLLVSLPVSFWVASILLINEVPDIRADAWAGKRTLAVRLGRSGTRVLYLCLQLAAVLALVTACWSSLIPWPLLALPAILLAGAVRAAGAIAVGDRARLRRAIEMTLAIHALGGLWLATGIALSTA